MDKPNLYIFRIFLGFLKIFKFLGLGKNYLNKKIQLKLLPSEIKFAIPKAKTT